MNIPDTVFDKVECELVEEKIREGGWLAVSEAITEADTIFFTRLKTYILYSDYTELGMLVANEVKLYWSKALQDEIVTEIVRRIREAPEDWQENYGRKD